MVYYLLFAIPLLLPLIPFLLFAAYILRTLLQSYLLYNSPHLSLLPRPPPTPHSLPPSLHWLLGTGDWGILSPYRRVKSSQIVSALLAGCRASPDRIFLSRSLLGRPCVILFDTPSIRHIVFRKPYAYTKLTITSSILAPLVGRHGLLLAEGDHHKRLKLQIAPAMHFGAVARFSAVFLEEAAGLRDIFAAANGAPLPLRIGTGRATCRTILRAFFPNQVLSDHRMATLAENYSLVFDSLGKVLVDMLLQQAFSFLPQSVLSAWCTRNADAKGAIRRMTQDMLSDAKTLHPTNSPARGGDADKRTSAGRDRPDTKPSLPTSMVDYFLRTKPGAQQLTIEEQIDNLLTFLAAGQSTTAFSISYSLWRLGKHSDWQARVAAELDACPVWRDASRPPEERVDAVCHLPCLERVIKESLRMYPPILLSSRSSKTWDTLAGYTIPPETSVVIPIGAIHYDPAHWVEPLHFDPDRFLPEAEAARDSMAWLPFLYGPRGCIGQRFAMREMTVIIATIVHSFVLSVDHSLPDPDGCNSGIAGYPVVKIFASPRAS